MPRDCILALDQGTTSSRAIAFDAKRNVVHVAQAEFAQIFPREGEVEHDPEAIWWSTIETARSVFDAVESQGYRVAAIAVTNQRETSIVWQRDSGRAVHNAIVWQDRRTADRCRQLVADGHEPDFQIRTGLLLDPYFSCSKLEWLLDRVERVRAGAEAGKLAFGTVDSFLIWRLTGGRRHVTDVTNASRTGLFNINTLQWDDALLRLWNVPAGLLSEVLDCDGDFGETDPELFGRPIPIRGVAGDQQAAAIGQACFAPGSIKSTYGTGCFVLLNTGEQVVRSHNRLLSTVAARFAGKTSYALEGSIFSAGSAVQWLRDGLGIIDHAEQTQELASGLASNGGVYLVPAFTGLGAPHWDPDARGAVSGLTRGAGPAHFARAALESACYQTYDLLQAMLEDGGAAASLRVDGGMSANDWTMQFLADILAMPVERPRVLETTAFGAAYLAGLRAGVYGSPAEFAADWSCDARFVPQSTDGDRRQWLAGWHDAVSRVKRQ